MKLLSSPTASPWRRSHPMIVLHHPREKQMSRPPLSETRLRDQLWHNKAQWIEVQRHQALSNFLSWWCCDKSVRGKKGRWLLTAPGMVNHQNPMEGWWNGGFLTQDQLDQLGSPSCCRRFFFTRFLPVSHPLRVAPAIARGKSLLSHQRLRHVSHLHLDNTPLQEEFLRWFRYTVFRH